MALFYVTYDLIKYKDYPKLWDRLKQYKAQRVLLSVWALHGNYKAADLRNDLTGYIDGDDKILIIESADSAWNKLTVDPNKV